MTSQPMTIATIESTVGDVAAAATILGGCLCCLLVLLLLLLRCFNLLPCKYSLLEGPLC